jgi:multiple antibiotic resistance protein
LEMNIAATALTLFLVLDPFGNMATLHALLARVSPERRQWVLIRELLCALVILMVFLWTGTAVLNTLGIHPYTLSISGGILLFLIALGMVFPSRSMLNDPVSDGEPFIVPFAVPLMVGPSVMALLLLLATRYPDQKWSSSLAVLLAWSATAVVLLVSRWIMRLLGTKGTHALERLMGLLLILLAVQMFLDGLMQGDWLKVSR